MVLKHIKTQHNIIKNLIFTTGGLETKIWILADPFGGDPFKEADPFRTSSEDFFKKPSKPDPFSQSDPFGKSATLPSKVKSRSKKFFHFFSMSFLTISFLLTVESTLSQQRPVHLHQPKTERPRYLCCWSFFFLKMLTDQFLFTKKSWHQLGTPKAFSNSKSKHT